MPLLLNATKKDAFIRSIKNRLLVQNRNFIGVFLGPTGSGKSYSALALANAIDPLFTVDNVVFSAKELVQLLKKKPRRGTAIVFDEAGVNYSNRSSMSHTNKVIGEIIQTFRYMNLALIMTVPDFGFIDIQARKLVHFRFEHIMIDYSKKIAWFKPLQLKIHPVTGEEYKFYPLKRYPDTGEITKVRAMGFKLPPDDLIEAYEKKKDDFNMRLLDRSLDRLEGKKKEKKVDDEPLDIKYELDAKMKRIAYKIKDNLDQFLKYNKKKGYSFSLAEIRTEFPISSIQAKRIVKFLMSDEDVRAQLDWKNQQAQN